uniref:PB1 domain-containing protein n=1 Tax=Hanusia phi TaxID=3032 RepID=A0A7S0E203_9CRYP|mmetsp:Transcript_14346/g.33023  ORF Transcript_14346/g.33023 Transcript_14346/m.33023 type:complete len:172 (+) Transcript_14346:1-516(+)
MQSAQRWIMTMACCDNRMPDVKTTDEIQGPFLITCFDESDTELRDIKVQPTTNWTEMQLCISEVLGAQAMFAYDDGTGVDFPVRNEEEWNHFLDILRNDKSVNGEYDILLLSSGGWERYNAKQEKNNREQGNERNVSGKSNKLQKKVSFKDSQDALAETFFIETYAEEQTS